MQGQSCTPWTRPSAWPATVPQPPWASVAAFGGGTLDAVKIRVNASTAVLTIGGGGGGLMTPAIVTCPGNATIVGCAYSGEASGSYQYPSFSSLHSWGPCACSDGSYNASVFSGTGIGTTPEPSATVYVLPSTLCGWNPVCTPMAMPPSWPVGAAYGASQVILPPYSSAVAAFGGTLDRVIFTVNGTGALSTMGGAGGALTQAVTCPRGASIVGFSYTTDASSGWQYDTPPRGTFSGLHRCAYARCA